MNENALCVKYVKLLGHNLENWNLLQTYPEIRATCDVNKKLP